ncbi:toll-like receptor 5 [Paramisgurnus dabryanus]|uniref:toll-like receptor 5 n=1 Tax=Paramisgurnus dabryanus TaxID=90735 RepID=UPI003CCF1AD1
MTPRYLSILILYISIQIVNCTSVCFIDGSKVYCIDRGLQQIPELPTYASYVNLNINNITKLNETSFSHLEGLQILRIQHQTPGLVIRNNTFRRLSNLISLDLDYNRMLKMETGALNGLMNLKNLSLTGCSLDDSILSGDFLKPLVSLEILILRDNNIGRIRPAPFFINMRRFHTLDISFTTVKSICEEDLLNFQGKRFKLLNLSSMRLYNMNQYWSGWDKCGNPFQNMSINVLDLSQNGFEVNMAKRFIDAITGTKIHHLILSDSSSMGSSFGHINLKDPDRFTFRGLNESGVKIFDLSRSYIFSLSYSLFGALSDLEQITLAQNEINKIENDAFLGMTNLLKLNLSSNLLSAIDSKTFMNLHKLQVLDLSYNNIRVLGHQSFQGLANLLNLNLTGNVLHTVYQFATLPNLKQLYLGQNRITSLYGLPNIGKNLTTIDLDSNRLTSMSALYTILQEFPEMVEIILSYNGLLDCYNKGPTGSPKLQILDLRNTYIEVLWSQGKCLDVFNNLHQLQQLSLSSNLLQSLPKDVFKGLTSLIFLDLSFNSLKYLPNGIFPETLQILNLEYNSIYSVDPHLFSSLTHLSLLQNQFRCDCKLKDFQTWLNQSSTILVHPVENVTCASPEDQHMVPVLRSSIRCED